MEKNNLENKSYLIALHIAEVALKASKFMRKENKRVEQLALDYFRCTEKRAMALMSGKQNGKICKKR